MYSWQTGGTHSTGIISCFDEISSLLYHLQSLATEGISLEQRHALTDEVYDELIISVLRIVERLDLTSNKPSEIESEVS